MINPFFIFDFVKYPNGASLSLIEKTFVNEKLDL